MYNLFHSNISTSCKSYVDVSTTSDEARDDRPIVTIVYFCRHGHVFYTCFSRPIAKTGEENILYFQTCVKLIEIISVSSSKPPDVKP